MRRPRFAIHSMLGVVLFITAVCVAARRLADGCLGLRRPWPGSPVLLTAVTYNRFRPPDQNAGQGPTG